MNFLSSAKDRLAALKIFQVLALVLILQASLNSHIQILSIALIILLAINDYFRKDLSEPVKNISYIFSNIIICFICYKFKNDEALFYYTLMLVDLIVVNKKIIKSIFLINFISNIVSIGILYSNNLLYTIGSALSNYAVTLVICFLIRNIIMEKAKKEQLYEELKETNLTLKEYSNKIEELTITNERTRIAQELHDSIGHSLVALSMNLEYAENVIDIKPEKAKVTIQNCHTLSKDCLNTLRKAVSILKETANVTNLREAIEKIFVNFSHTDKYQFNFDFDEEVEKASVAIKTCIFKTLREAITNGIKHGNATSFNIHIYKLENNIIFKIENNGKHCKEIVRSNGIIGMEERVHALKGEIFFNSDENSGFTTEGKIPENTTLEVNNG
jgi:signal transduction histidine kinase